MIARLPYLFELVVLNPYEILPIAQENKYLGIFKEIFLFSL